MPSDRREWQYLDAHILTTKHRQVTNCIGTVSFFQNKHKLSKYQKLVGIKRKKKGFRCDKCGEEWDS